MWRIKIGRSTASLVVLTALGCYSALGWRNRYLASALILGPLTWLRPAVTAAGAIYGGTVSPAPLTCASAALAVAAVLATEPLASRLWYTKPGLPQQTGPHQQGTPKLADQE